MNKATVTTIIVIIILLLVGWFFFWRMPKDTGEMVGEDQGSMEESGVLITAKHEYNNGTHIIAGEVSLPTPCHILATDSEVSNGGKEVLVFFDVTTQAETCAQVVTPARFKIEFQAAEDARISALWNGMGADLNLIPVAPGETLDEFEIFIKG